MYYFIRQKVAGKAIFKLDNLAILNITGHNKFLEKVMNKLTTYIKESVEEMKKVTWPTKKETYQYTLLIIVISLSMALFIGLLDYGFSAVIKNFLYKI